jgi:LmbE family N-acetylglucosaminyl deacetylase
MDSMLVISPHYDDAVLSAGQLIAGADMTTMIVTVCAGVPSPSQSTPFDAKCGFPDSTDAHKARRVENEDAARVLDASTYDMNILDGQYGEHVDERFVEAALVRCVRVVADDVRIVVSPLGLAHPDHVAVADAVRVMRPFWTKQKIEIYAYEDLPARVVWPEDVPPALDRWHRFGWAPALHGPYPPGDLNTKLAACSMYASQWEEVCGVGGAACIAVPERIWRMS